MAIEIRRRFEKLGYIIYATRSTAAALNGVGAKALLTSLESKERQGSRLTLVDIATIAKRGK